jgi:curved DNA-binding protein
VKIPVDLYTCVLGGEVDVPTPSGRKLALTIPPGTSNGKVFRLRGQGMPRLQNSAKRGDLFAEAVVQLPTALSDEERELFRRLRELDRRDAAAGVA